MRSRASGVGLGEGRTGSPTGSQYHPPPHPQRDTVSLAGQGSSPGSATYKLELQSNLLISQFYYGENGLMISMPHLCIQSHVQIPATNQCSANDSRSCRGEGTEPPSQSHTAGQPRAGRDSQELASACQSPGLQSQGS